MPFILAGASLRVGLVAGDSLLVTADSPATVTQVIGGALVPGVNKPGMDSRSLYYGPLLSAAELLVSAAASTDFEVVRGLYNIVEPGVVVTLTASDIASPQPGILADTTATYKLADAPYTRYRSNGSALVEIGAGGGGAWGSITGTLSAQTDLQAALDARQPLDADLTAIAALATATYGRSLLTMADAAAVRGSLGLHTDAIYLTANAMGALVIDTSKALNTKTVAADTTFTFSGAPAQANTYFGLALTNGATARTITIPSSFSEAQQTAITSFVLPASATIELVWRWDGATYILKGEPVREAWSVTWSMIGTTTARDYPVMLKTRRGRVVEGMTSKCVSGTATATGKIDGVALGGTANAVSSTEAEQAHSTANTMAVGTDFALGMTAGAVDPQVTIWGYYQ